MNISKKISLVEVTGSTNARIERALLQRSLENAGFYGIVVPTRHENDALRITLQSLFAQVGSIQIEENGTKVACSLVAVPARNVKAGDLRIDIHFELSGDEGSFGHIGAILKSKGEAPLWITESEKLFSLLPAQLQQDLQDARVLVAYGQNTAFYSDLRKVADTILKGMPKFGHGFVIASEDRHYDTVHNCASVFSGLAYGKFAVRVSLELEPTPTNLGTLQADLLESFMKRLQEIKSTFDQGVTGKALSTLGDRYEALKSEAAQIQKNLDIKFGNEWDLLENELLMGFMCSLA